MIGHTVEARQHPSTVEVLYGDRVLCTMPRLRGSAEHRIDYRHSIGSLVRKPGAFARYRFREELFPSLVFRAAYDALGRTHGERADVEYVRLLHLAATTSERRVETTLRAKLDVGDPCDYAAVQAQVHSHAADRARRTLRKEVFPQSTETRVGGCSAALGRYHAAQPAERTSACSSTVRVAASCWSGG